MLAVARPAAPTDSFADAAAALLRAGRPVAAALPLGPDAPSLSTFVSLLGAPNAAATRGSVRSLVVHPATAQWEWVGREIRRAAQESPGIRALVVLTPSSPLAWPAAREGQMLLGWLAEARRKGLEAWVVYGSDRAQLGAVEGVRLLGVPPLGQPGGAVVLEMADDGLRLAAAGDPLRPAPAPAPAAEPAGPRPAVAPTPASG